jgi:HD-GYP domain-containing protein (c-di-GMP phosphodiesterase class II)
LTRTFYVSAGELARWTGLDSTGWLEDRAAAGQLPSGAGRKGYLFDPRCLHEWLSAGDASTVHLPRVDVNTLSEVSLALAGGERPDAVSRRILDRALKLLESECGAIFLTDDDSWLDLCAATGIDSDLPEALQGAAIWVAASGEPLLLPDLRRVDDDVTFVDDGEPHDSLAVPFVVEDRVSGVLVAMRRRDEPPFNEGHLSLATVLATELGLAIERTRLHDSLGRRLSVAQDQLEKYAVDTRRLFGAEKARAAELREALYRLEDTYLATVRGLAAAVEAKDEYTAGHLVRVTHYGLSILELIDPKSAGDPMFEYGFLLHDVGKMGVPDAVLQKEGPLGDDEWRLMRRHPLIGVRILAGIPFLAGATNIIRSHHERWDGSGYPDGLDTQEIPLGARVFAIADAFDAMTTDRPYRKAMSVETAIGELGLQSGTQFWPDAVDAMVSLSNEGVASILGSRRRSREAI